MTYYPVIIPTLCRYEHFKRCVESLARNTHASETELVIGLDYPAKESHWEGYRKIAAYVDTITGFKKVTVFKRTENYGAIKNLWGIRDYVLERYDAYISSEDDNEFSPCFLDFMNKMLERYRDEPKVVSVCACIPESWYGVTQDSVMFMPIDGAWGYASWKNKYLEKRSVPYEYYKNLLNSFRKSLKYFLYSPADYSMLSSMVKQNDLWGDVMYGARNYMEGYCQVLPTISLVRNWGQDGSGLHCGKNDELQKKYERQVISQDAVYKFEECQIQMPSGIRHLMYIHHFHAGWLRNMYHLFRITLVFVKDRFVKF